MLRRRAIIQQSLRVSSTATTAATSPTSARRKRVCSSICSASTNRPRSIDRPRGRSSYTLMPLVPIAAIKKEI